jgi:hypothetical protein
MSDSTIQLSDEAVLISTLRVPGRDVVDYLRSLPDDQWAEALVQALQVGVYCLERARAAQDLDFVKRQVEGLLNTVQCAVEKIPQETQRQLSAQIGTGDGQVLAPVQTLVKDVSMAASEKLEEIRRLLQDEVDPSRDTSALGKALRALRDLLDPMRTDSIQGALDTAVKQATSETGALAKSVREVVGEALKPLADNVADLSKEIRARDAASDALGNTTLKGETYEEEVVCVLRVWAQGLGQQVEHVGSDSQPGDVLVVCDEHDGHGNQKIVAEAKDRQDGAGRKVISDIVSKAMATRGATGAIYVSKTRAGLASEVGEWAEGRCEQGRWVACTHEHLTTAIRFLIVQRRLELLRETPAAVDAVSVAAGIQRIRTALRRIATIKAKATEVRSCADAIQQESDHLRKEVEGALGEIEQALRRSTSAAAEYAGSPLSGDEAASVGDTESPTRGLGEVELAAG